MEALIFIDGGDEIKTEVEDEPMGDLVKLIPIVYTTKLDDMCIFRQNLQNFTTADIIDVITLESKPKFSENHVMYPSIKKQTNYNKVVEKIDELNEKVNKRNEVYNNVIVKAVEAPRNDKNIELLRMCKPCSVVLEDIKTSTKGKIRKVYGRKNLLEMDKLMNTKDIIVSDNKQIYRYLEKYVTSRDMFMVFLDVCSNEIDVYYVNNKHNGHVTDYYRIDCMNLDTLRSHTGDKEIIKFHCCCWFKRQNMIFELWPKYISQQSAKFISNKHKCIPGECSCCCRINDKEDTQPTSYKAIQNSLSKKVPKVNKVSLNDSVIRKRKNASHLFNKLTQDESSTLIDKALGYFTNLSTEKVTSKIIGDLNILNKPKRSIILPHYAVWLKNTTKNEVELYEIGKDGDVLSCSITKMDTKFIQRAIRENFLSKKYTKSYVFDVCCWIKRNEVIVALENVEKFPKLLKFIRSSHLCSVNNCVCCCKKDIDKLLTMNCLKTITLSERLKPTRNIAIVEPLKNTPDTSTSVKNQFPTLNNTNKNSQPVRQNTDKKSLPQRPVINSKPQNAKPVAIAPRPTPQDRWQKNAVEPNKNIFVIKVSPGDVKTQVDFNPVTKKIEVPQPGTQVLPQPPPNNVAPSPRFAVDTLISSILDRFKDVHLTINEDGKVAASLSTPVNTLSTAELRVLANILAHAQEQVNMLGLSPGTNLNRHAEVIKTVPRNETGPPPLAGLTRATVSSESVKVNTTEKTFPSTSNQINYTLPVIQTSETMVSDDKNDYQSFANLVFQKHQNYVESFASEATTSGAEAIFSPKIENVFSLQGVNNAMAADQINKNNSESNDSNLSTENENVCDNDKRANKRKSVNQPFTQSKIRVVSPSKLGMVCNDTGNLSTPPCLTPQFNLKGKIPNTTATQPIALFVNEVKNKNIQIIQTQDNFNPGGVQNMNQAGRQFISYNTQSNNSQIHLMQVGSNDSVQFVRQAAPDLNCKRTPIGHKATAQKSGNNSKQKLIPISVAPIVCMSGRGVNVRANMSSSTYSDGSEKNTAVGFDSATPSNMQMATLQKYCVMNKSVSLPVVAVDGQTIVVEVEDLDSEGEAQVVKSDEAAQITNYSDDSILGL